MINQYSNRKFIIGGMFLLIAIVYLIRLFFLQVIDESYKNSADNNSQRRVTKYPARGIIYDRNGKIMVFNEPAYDLMMIPMQVKDFDTLALCTILEITYEDLLKAINEAKRYSRYKPSVITSQISSQTYAVLQEKLFRFPGFFVQGRTLRKYPKPIAAHVLGYVGEVNDKKIKENPYYQSGDFIGISGIEQSYEEYLRGRKGVAIYMVDVHNRIMGSFAGGRFDTAAVIGTDLITSLDAELQEYGEKLLQNKIGSIVAIEPSTGEILVVVSSPSYDPGLLVGRIRSKNYGILSEDPLKPLFNRALMAKYPPGSTFKLVNGLIGLQEGVITKETTFGCSQGYHFGGVTVGCHGHPSPLDFEASIQHSCNSYYCNTFRKIIDNRKYHNTRKGFEVWRDYVLSFGIGRKLDTDLYTELKGNVPTSEYYDRYFGENRWKSLTIISLAIGQGEMGVTPLQMANLGCIIANRGYYYIPHVVKEIKGQQDIPDRFRKKQYTKVDSKYFDLTVYGMWQVVEAGTARIARIDSIPVCGKTGTAQNPHGEDHSIFLAFAPMDKPKIAIAVYIENGGFGATWAAPIASLMIEKYITGKTTRPDLEKYIMEGNLIP